MCTNENYDKYKDNKNFESMCKKPNEELRINFSIILESCKDYQA